MAKTYTTQQLNIGTQAVGKVFDIQESFKEGIKAIGDRSSADDKIKYDEDFAKLFTARNIKMIKMIQSTCKKLDDLEKAEV